MIMRLLWLGLGWASVALGALGAFLPVMPTVPFLLLAVWAFSRSSPELRNQILNNPKFGPQIRAWQERGVVSNPAKAWAVLTMTFGVLLAVWLGVPLPMIAVQMTVCIVISAYLITRPGR